MSLFELKISFSSFSLISSDKSDFLLSSSPPAVRSPLFDSSSIFITPLSPNFNI